MNIKALIEKRADLLKEAEGILAACETENRALNEEENSRYDAILAEVRSLDGTLDKAEALDKASVRSFVAEVAKEDPAVAEERAFADYILGRSNELRSNEQDVDWTNNNGAIIPTSIANRIIKEVKDRCPILDRATMYRVKGTLKVPVWGDYVDGSSVHHNITVGYQTEFSEITADAGKFTAVTLGGYLAGALTLIGKSVENNAVFSVTDFVVTEMAERIARWIEGQLLVGTGSSAAGGATLTTNGITADATDAITADELIELQACVKQTYQANACWTMSPATFTAIRQLKNGTGVYLLQDDFSGEFPYRLLGKPVYLSDNMPDMAAGAKAILYGDYSGLSVNFRENISIEVLREKYATQHALGVVSWFEFDSKVTDVQKLAVLTMKAS